MIQNKNHNIQLINQMAQAIFDKKGLNILALDVVGISSMTDYFLIAEGTVEKHVGALCEAIQEVMAKEGIKPLRVEGGRRGDWVVVDYGEILVHLFIPALREKYALERVWHAGKIIDLDLQITSRGREL